MTDPEQTGIERTEDGIEVTLTGRFNRVDGWAESREDLGLNKGGPDPVEGVEIVEEHEVYYDEDAQERVAGYEKVVLRFDDVDSLDAARARLYDKATERFEWGMGDEAQDVQDFAGRLPTEFDVDEATVAGGSDD